jgi:1-acyl-sn-glycerol-3-phosphate acyltransferase
VARRGQTGGPFLYRTLGRHVLLPTVRRLYRAEVAGSELVPATGPAILAANHESVLDPFALGLATPRTIRFMTKVELWRSPLLRPLLRGLGGFPVDRGRSDVEAVGRALQLIAAGEVLGIFPQGTCRPLRNRPWLRGAARLALVTGTPLVPVCLVGTERAIRPHRLRLGLPRVRVLVAPPIDVTRTPPTIAAARALTARVEAAVTELHAPYGPPAHAWID